MKLLKQRHDKYIKEDIILVALKGGVEVEVSYVIRWPLNAIPTLILLEHLIEYVREGVVLWLFGRRGSFL